MKIRTALILVYCLLGSSFFTSLALSAENTLQLLNKQLAPSTNFKGVETLNLDEEEQKGWHTDYVIKEKNGILEIGYCEYYSPYNGKEYGNITVNLGDYSIPMQKIDRDRVEVVADGVLLHCLADSDCIENRYDTSQNDPKNKSIQGTLKTTQQTVSRLKLYLTRKEKLESVATLLKQLLSTM